MSPSEFDDDARDRPDATTLDPAAARRLVRRAAALALAGFAAGVGAFAADRQRFAHSYLTAFLFVVTTGLGALLFVLVQHLTNAGWSAAPRRHMEWLSGLLPLSALLFVPVAALAHDVYHLPTGASSLAGDALGPRQSYLRPGFFFLRAGVFLIVWSALAWWFAARSREQDETLDADLTRRMRIASAPATLALAVTGTFAAFDWIMSLQPRWHSTIFGAYVCAGSVTSALSALALVTIALQRHGLLRHVSNVEHRHDIGKLLFGFTVFWAYVAFSQYFLIWYAAIPEETIFYELRWQGSWKTVSLLLLLGHFVVPFALLLARGAKRSALVLGTAAALLLVLHYVDLYWLVMPVLDVRGAHPSLVDLGALLGPVGLAALVVARAAARGPLFATGDPRLGEALGLENP